jgi:hypothetical protein
VEVESVKTSFLQRDSVSVGRCEVEEEDPNKGDKPSREANLPECPCQTASGRSGVECINTFQRDSMSDGR